MAKKRLNKKVVLIGSVIFVFLVLAAILVFLHLSRDPEKFVRDGDVAVKAADEAIDEEIKAEKYKEAERNYHRARARAKTDSLRIEVLFRLVDIYIKTDKWDNVRGCWNKIIQIDPENAKARFGRLKYFYIVADSGAGRVWREVESQASEFIEVADADLLAEDTAQWESFGPVGKRGQPLSSYLYLLRGRAMLEMTRIGAVTDPDESLARAIDDLEKVRELEPNNVDAYWYLAQAIVTKGDIFASRGNLEERDRASEQATELLEQAVDVAGAGAGPKAHINLLKMKAEILRARRGGSIVLAREQIQSLEPEYLSLVEKFPSNAEAFSELAGFYQQTGPQNLDKGIEAVERAVELEKENVTYAMDAANLYYRKFSVSAAMGQEQRAELYKAIEVAKNALTLPGAQDKPGPGHWVDKRNRTLLYVFLANCYIEQVLDSRRTGIGAESEIQEWLTKAEEAVHEIEQLRGSGEDPQVIKWRGMLELAEGNRNAAIRAMYAAYEQIKASEEPAERDAQLSYALVKVFEDTSEVGAVREFLESAIIAGIVSVKPEALLDYADVLLKLRAYGGSLAVVNFFEENYWADERSQTLRIRAYIGAMQFEEAEEELAKRVPDDPNTISLNLVLMQGKIRQVGRAIAQRQREGDLDIVSRGLSGAEGGVERSPERDKELLETEPEGTDELMRAELKGYNDAYAGLVDKLLSIEPNSVDDFFVAAVCGRYIRVGKAREARELADRFLEYFPDNTRVQFYKQLTSEPEPNNVSQERRKEIEKEVLSNIAEPLRRAIGLGRFYRRHNEPNETAAEFKKVFEIEAVRDEEGVVDESALARTEEILTSQRMAAVYFSDVALERKDVELAEQIADIAQRNNIDDCEGKFFAAILAMVKEEYKDALTMFDECLKQRPVFSYAYMLRSKVNTALGNEHASIVDAQKAASLNPVDGNIARVLADVLYKRNRRLGGSASSDQIIETKNALIKAVQLNPGELWLLNFYSEYISDEDPEEALAIRERLQRAVPSVKNALSLGKMAMRLALREADAERKTFLLDTAGSAFEQARAYEPQNKEVLEAQAEYYRLIDRGEEAEELLVQSQDKELLWSYYFRSGRFEDAKGVLEQLYQSEPNNGGVVKGLLLVAERTGDKEAVKKYSEELLLLEDRVENHLYQVQSFLNIGLVKEAEYKLQSLREKYPDEPRALLLEAWLTMRQGQLERALELINRNLEIDQDNALAWRLRGEVNRLMANYDQAIIDLKRSKSLSDKPKVRISLAKAYLQAGRAEDAITELENTAYDPESPMESGLLLEQIYQRLGRRNELIKFYSEVLKRFPDNLLWYSRAGSFAMSTGDFKGAEYLYGLLLEKSKKYGMGDPDALGAYLRALVLGGKFDKVFEEAGKYVDGDFAPIAFFRMAEAKLELGDRATAIQYCRKAVDKAGTDEAFASHILEKMYDLLGAREVQKYCKERLDANPNSQAANFTMFNLAKLSGEYNKALNHIDKCLEIIGGPDNPNAADYVIEKAIVLQLAYIKTSDNDYLKRAIAAYESLLVKMPNNTDVLNNLAYMLAENNERLADSLEYSKRAHEARPNNANLMDTYAYVLYKNGKYSEAAEVLQSALQQYEQDGSSIPAEVYEHLGMIKEKLGSVAEAIAAYKQALEVGERTFSEPVKERIRAVIERLSR